MKGKITVEVEGGRVNCRGSMLFSNDLEPYLVLHSVAKCLDITTVEQFARLALVSTLHKDFCEDKFEQTKYVIPKEKEES